MANPKVTVLMSVHNAERYLGAAIDSILKQTFRDFEFLIIDDGSTDNSVSLIQRYDDIRISLLRNDGNLGLAASLNKGLQLAKGDYVARMDADDISSPERLACQVRFLDSHPAVGVCGSWVRLFPGFNNYIWKFHRDSEDIRCRQFYKVGVAHPAVMMRRRFFTDHGLLYDPGYRLAEDYELWGRAIRHMEFANIQKTLLDYRISSDQTCSRNGAEQKGVVATLRLQRLQELGIEPTPDQQQLHEAIMNDTLPTGQGSLALAELWLLRLDAANREAGVYPALLFTRHICYLWFEICCRSSDDGVCSWRRYRGSSLLEVAPYPVLQRMRFAGGWLARHLRRNGLASRAKA
jgi:hypothetical protein